MRTTFQSILRPFAVLFLAGEALTASAQAVTYNHDASVMNQFTVQETGLGNLQPDFYYSLAHPDYKNEASATNKLGYRSLFSAALYKEKPMAEQIDSALSTRAKIEALNVADRQIDLAWKVEQSKIENKQQLFKKNIDQILYRGGTNEDKKYWTTIYNAVDCGLRAVREAYLPNSQRKKQYLAIYKDLVLKNNQLVDCLCLWSGLKEAESRAGGTLPVKTNAGDIARSCYGRWKVAMAGGGGVSGGSGVGVQ